MSTGERVLQPSEKKIEESKLVLEGLVQHYKLVAEPDKSRILVELLDNLEFNQVCNVTHGHLPNLKLCTCFGVWRAVNSLQTCPCCYAGCSDDMVCALVAVARERVCRS
jgi:hypothetical protein